jgi:hypothetical protein
MTQQATLSFLLKMSFTLKAYGEMHLSLKPVRLFSIQRQFYSSSKLFSPSLAWPLEINALDAARNSFRKS